MFHLQCAQRDYQLLNLRAAVLQKRVATQKFVVSENSRSSLLLERGKMELRKLESSLSQKKAGYTIQRFAYQHSTVLQNSVT